MVKLNYGGVPLLVISGHAPHTGRPAAEVRQFWSNLTSILNKHYKHDLQCVMCLDANAHFDIEKPPAIGPHGLEMKSNLSAEYFSELLSSFDLCLPCSWSQYHSGDTSTWVSPATGQAARCDYIAVPISWKQAKIKTWNAYTLDHGAKRLDHSPTFLLADVAYCTTGKTRAPVAFDRSAVARKTPQELESIFDGFVQPEWDMSIDEHATYVANQVSGRLAQAVPAAKYKPRKSYISPASWALRKQRIALSRNLRQVKHALQSASTRAYYVAWRDFVAPSPPNLLTEVLTLFARAVRVGRNLKELSAELHRGLRADRTAYLVQIADEAQNLPPNQFHQHLRRIGVCGKAKARQLKPLPMLRSADGTILETVEDIASRWKDFFSEQEDGRDSTPQELVDRQIHALNAQTEGVEWQDLFTLPDLERQFRQVTPLRAVFDDAIPGEFLHGNPALAAKIFYPLYLKIMLLGKEPIAFKGGMLVAAYKGKGDPSICTNFRSLMVSSNLSKTLHALLRRALMPHFEKVALPFQVGGLPHQSITQLRMR